MVNNRFVLTELANNTINQLIIFYSNELNRNREDLNNELELISLKNKLFELKELIQNNEVFFDDEKLKKIIDKYTPVLSLIYESY